MTLLIVAGFTNVFLAAILLALLVAEKLRDKSRRPVTKDSPPVNVRAHGTYGTIRGAWHHHAGGTFTTPPAPDERTRRVFYFPHGSNEIDPARAARLEAWRDAAAMLRSAADGAGAERLWARGRRASMILAGASAIYRDNESHEDELD